MQMTTNTLKELMDCFDKLHKIMSANTSAQLKLRPLQAVKKGMHTIYVTTQTQHR